MTWKSRRVLITGATGLLGSALALRLLREGARLSGWSVPDRPWSRLDLEPSAGLHRRTLDVARDDLASALREDAPEVVFHFAARTLVEDAREDPLGTFQVNAGGTARLLEALRAAGVRPRVVLASSDKAYGRAERLPYREEDALRPGGPYEASKACAEMIGRAYATTFGDPLVVTRSANLYGPGDCHASRLVPGVLADLARGRAPRIRSDGRFRRDYLFLDDAVEAYLLLGDPERMIEPGRVFNLGTGRPVEVLEIVRLLAAFFPGSPAPEIENRAGDEIRDQWVDPARARAELGWEARTPLAEGLAQTVEWYRSTPGALE